MGEVKVPSRSPVTVSDVVAEMHNGSVAGISYTLTNTANTGLVAIILDWQFSGFSNHASVQEKYDSWSSDMIFIEPRSSHPDQMGTRVINPPKNGAGVETITGTVVYAEFADGSRIGLNPELTHAELLPDREALLQEFASLLQRGEIGALDKTTLSIELQKDVRLAFLQKLSIEQGIPAVLDARREPRRLKP